MAAVVAVVVALVGRRDVCILLTACDIGTQRGVEAEILKSVYLVVEVCAADKLAAMGDVVLLVEHGERVARSQLVIGVHPVGVAIVARLRPGEVAVEVVQRLVEVVSEEVSVILGGVAIRALRRIHIDCRAHGRSVGIAVLGVHALGVERDVEVVVEERRGEGDRSRSTLEA